MNKKFDAKFPNIVHVETTNVCNLKCIHCPQSNLDNIPNYTPKYLSLEKFKKVVQEVALHKGILRLTPDGEPTLHPDWDQQVDLVLNSSISTFAFNTNGILLNEDKIEKLLQKTSVNVAIEFSIDSLYKESYEKIRRDDYIKLMSNIFYLIKRRNDLKRENVKILVSCIIQPELQKGEYEDFVKFWSGIADKVITRHYVDTRGLTPHKPEVQKEHSDRWECPVIFTRLVVGMDGEIRYCPDDWLKKTVIGDISMDSIENLWNGEYMNEIRKSHIEKKFNVGECSKCKEWNVIKWGNDYVKALNDLFQ